MLTWLYKDATRNNVSSVQSAETKEDVLFLRLKSLSIGILTNTPIIQGIQLFLVQYKTSFFIQNLLRTDKFLLAIKSESYLSISMKTLNSNQL